MATATKKRKGGRKKVWEMHKAYSYINKKSGKTVHVPAHRERLTK